MLGFLSVVCAGAGELVVTPAELAEARRWSAAKFEGVQSAPAAEPALVVLANHGPVQKNARGGRPMHLADKEYTRGLYCHAPSKIIVRLPGPGSEVHRHRGRGQQRPHQWRARQRGLLGEGRRRGEVPLRRDARRHARQACRSGAGRGEGVCLADRGNAGRHLLRPGGLGGGEDHTQGRQRTLAGGPAVARRGAGALLHRAAVLVCL